MNKPAPASHDFRGKRKVRRPNRATNSKRLADEFNCHFEEFFCAKRPWMRSGA